MKRAAAVRPPAGHWPISELFPWVVVAGCSLACSHCGATDRAPLPRDGEGAYNHHLAAFLEEDAHRTIELVRNLLQGVDTW